MNRVAHVAATAPYAQIIVASGPDWSLPVAFLGLLWLCLWKGPLRWLGLPLALAVNLAPKPPTPDVWVDGAGLGRRRPRRQGRDPVPAGREAVRRGALGAAARPGSRRRARPVRDASYACDHWSCTPLATARVKVASAWNLKRPLKDGRFAQMCGSSEVVILRNDFAAGDLRGAAGAHRRRLRPRRLGGALPPGRRQVAHGLGAGRARSPALDLGPRLSDDVHQAPARTGHARRGHLQRPDLAKAAREGRRALSRSARARSRSLRSERYRCRTSRRTWRAGPASWAWSIC